MGENLMERQPRIPELAQLENPHVKLLRELALQNETSEAAKILDNFRVGGLILSYIFSLPVQNHSLPDLPDDLTRLKEIHVYVFHLSL